MVDTIIATVDDKPITLLELGKRFSPPRTLTLAEASSNPEAKEILNSIILEQMLVAEAERRNIKVGDEDVDHYISEVKKRNSLSDDAFQKTLQNEHKTVNDYREQVKVDILKSKIASNFIKSSAAVTEEEIDNFIRQGMSPSSSPGDPHGAMIHIKQIFLSNKKYTADEARALGEKIKKEVQDEETFETFAKQYSDGSEAAEGGDMGVIAEKDLSPDIFDALLPLKSGDVSIVITAPQGYFLYQLVERISADNASSNDSHDEKPQVSDALRLQVRQKLEQEKIQSKMISYIETELPKFHTVDKRL